MSVIVSMWETVTPLAIDQPTPVQPPGGDRIMKLVGVGLWAAVVGCLIGVIFGGGWMWVDHSSGVGARGGTGVKVVIGALIGAAVVASAASLVTFAMN
ncbi:hypothetical protein Gbro_4871 (plasmid) [Gordonia bronchialis DSM 43247]|uniref:Integral membrane protein n=1 Tax=Gordonia bronchialis (strain ATCC 25592 / DSM 43247 / BCRC 13721 / JCM 3198 / KCTC 3076 / NBRC 16047 / NCTC 10667) TaxID=526226 RepID=D0LFD5_GORB4|nr:hypothetical protein [Gordonia bronchialis]ACY23984.1 hypothetical protein Gbro_4871 [Gordonia bronchialis DSM 43247]MCC3326044.1 hypothetical protein [Gordonia bronchialis]QGS27311.1 hypothetical protein FOB84_24315 [Gordonia bronchialis]STS10854.1 Uncharacterised protein [Gordonia bronchialis]